MTIGRQVGIFLSWEDVQHIEKARGAVSKSKFMGNLVRLGLKDPKLVEKALRGEV